MSLKPSDGELPIPLFDGADKLVHFTIYFILVFLLCFSFARKGYALFLAAFFGVIFGIFMELGQYFVPSRSFEYLDILANSLGCLGAYFLPVYQK